MSIQIGVNFEYKGELSNFARDSFETLTDMRNVLDTDIDEGHISYCIETGKHYVFNKSNATWSMQRSTSCARWASISSQMSSWARP